MGSNETGSTAMHAEPLEALLGRLKSPEIDDDDVHWLDELRHDLDRDPGDPHALERLHSRRFLAICSILGLSERRGAELFRSSLGTGGGRDTKPHR